MIDRTDTADIVDATVVAMAIAKQAQVVTSDQGDVFRAANVAEGHLVIIEA